MENENKIIEKFNNYLEELRREKKPKEELEGMEEDLIMAKFLKGKKTKPDQSFNLYLENLLRSEYRRQRIYKEPEKPIKVKINFWSKFLSLRFAVIALSIFIIFLIGIYSLNISKNLKGVKSNNLLILESETSKMEKSIGLDEELLVSIDELDSLDLPETI